MIKINCILLLFCQAGETADLVYCEPLDYGDLYLLESEILGSQQPVAVGLPNSFDSTGSYPVLLVLDGDSYFELAYSAVSALSGCGGMPEMIVIGIGTDDPMSFYTPTNAPIPDGTPMPASGRGPDYLDYIEHELLPSVESTFPTEPYTVLFGHSMAGLFTIYAMLEGDGGIDGFIASSPSLWWDSELLTSLVPSWRSETGRNRTRLYISMGNEGETMLPPAERFVSIIGESTDSDILFRQFPGTVHQYVPFRSFPEGIEYIFEPWRLNMPVQDMNLQGLEEHYDSLSRIYGYAIEIPEASMNTVGYSLLGRGNLHDALEAFRMNAETYPGSANVYDSLGEALLAAGDTTAAVENYRRSLELDPDNSNAESVLERLDKAR